MVTYTLDSKNILYLILKRKLHWKGWEFPKGGVEQNETKLEAVRREIQEETGLRIEKIKSHFIFGKYKYAKQYLDRPGIVGQTYKLFSVEVKRGNINLDKKEHSLGVWVKYEKAMRLLTYQNQKKSLMKVNRWLERKIK